MNRDSSKVYIVAVDMGYGHQRAVFPLEHIATTPESWPKLPSPIISANVYPGIPESDKAKWQETRGVYEWVSRMRSVPVLGDILFGIMDYFQKIEPFYPKRDLSKPTLQVKQIYKMIKSGLGKHLIDTLNENPLPYLTSFFIPAFFAEEHGYKGDIYCLCTDSDISRAWAPLHPKESRITYLAPTDRVRERLIRYGVRPEKIIMTGFPLPKELLGDVKTSDSSLEALHRRIVRLDPERLYEEKYAGLLSSYFKQTKVVACEPVALTFAVGGASAQVDIGISAMLSLKPDIEASKINLTMVAGTSKEVFEMCERAIKDSGLEDVYGSGKIKILFNANKFEYFREFNELIGNTDVLWTKPSELSFYAGLGLPIIIAPPLGSQEEFNRSWLYSIEAGMDEEDPKYTHEWLADWLTSGRLALSAVNGFLNAPRQGTQQIEDVLLSAHNNINNTHTA